MASSKFSEWKKDEGFTKGVCPALSCKRKKSPQPGKHAVTRGNDEFDESRPRVPHETPAKVAAFVVLMLLAGTRVFPWLLRQIERTGSAELFTLAVAAIALGVDFGSAELFGVSFALGAFFAGVVVNESDLSHRAARDLRPLQDAFAALFFVAVGMLFNPAILVQQPWRVPAVVGVIVLGKSLAAFALVRALRYPLTVALTVAAELAQIGEFSFILAALGLSLGLLP